MLRLHEGSGHPDLSTISFHPSPEDPWNETSADPSVPLLPTPLRFHTRGDTHPSREPWRISRRRRLFHPFPFRIPGVLALRILLPAPTPDQPFPRKEADRLKDPSKIFWSFFLTDFFCSPPLSPSSRPTGPFSTCSDSREKRSWASPSTGSSLP